MRGVIMPVRFADFWQRRGRAWRALLLGLALLLPLAQLGMLQHAQSHHEEGVAEQSDQRHAALDLCDVCLAFAHLGAAHASVVHAPLLLSGLSFGAVHAQAAILSPAGPRSLHNRGPPTVL